MDCLFCKIINGEIPSYKIYEDELVIVVLDINPKENGHTLVVPKKHYTDYLELDSNIVNHFFEISKNLGQEIKEKMNAQGITFAWNYGSEQIVKHFHLHIIPRYETDEELSIEEVYNKLK